MEVGMLPHNPVGRCCARQRFNTVGGIDERNSPDRLGTALRRKMRTLAGDHAAVAHLELVLPETGVCSRSAASNAGQCCGGPAPAAVDACCVADANAKQEGKTGCGCAA
jgi:hypothetical protein